jgi:hypothetical protein
LSSVVFEAFAMVVNAALSEAWQAERDWVDGQIDCLPDPWQDRARKQYVGLLRAARQIPDGTGRQGEQIRAANQWLLRAANIADAVQIPVGMSDSDLCAKADELARECLSMAGSEWLKTPEVIRARMAKFVGRFGIAPPALPYSTKTGKRAGIEDGPAIARMTDSLWWRRALRRHQARELERAAIALGYVRKGGEIYASDATVARRLQQRKRNAAALEAMQAVREDTGEVCELAEVVAASVANPVIRRGELMTRLAGFDLIAAELGHAAEFVTLTCPTEFHPYKADGTANEAHKGETPRQAQKWLTETWAKCRAALARRGVRVYGFRVAEPHKTGVPHWHAVLFMAARYVEAFRDLVRKYFIGEAADAARAAHGVSFLTIDRAAHKGGAAGYLAKYISKNIDGGGYQVQLTLEGGETIDPSQRVEAWASTWGIRQFQQIGGPPVGIWREARRLEKEADNPEVIEAVRAAADVGQKTNGQRGAAAAGWKRYVETMGGPTVARRNLPVRCAVSRAGERWDYVADAPRPLPPTRYGEQAPGRVFGLTDGRGVYPSMRYVWVMRRKLQGVGQARDSGPWTRVNNCTQGVGNGGDFDKQSARFGRGSGRGNDQTHGKGRVTGWSSGGNWRPGGHDRGIGLSGRATRADLGSGHVRGNG